MKLLKALLSVGLTLALIWALQTRFGPVPPVGKFLNPQTGFWQNAESRNIKPEEDLQLTGLNDQVTIKFDEHRVPHIFARNEHDLYYAQGYVTARDRLWQMDMQTRAASGRLSEVVGTRALELDRYRRRMGMGYGAEQAIAEMMKDPRTRRSIEAYTDGINQYIRDLTIRNYPIEFKLLDYKPEEWKPINCAYLLKAMTETLAGGTDELAMTNTLNHFGAAVTNDLFPDQSFQQDPIIPVGTKWNSKPLPIPQPSKAFKDMMMTGGKLSQGKSEGIGSNNWAVSGSKTASGFPILANDPHLHLTFPSIWYQVQLTAPGVNVYGASLPGAPNVIIGYNQKVSWGVTNVDADVLDWYRIKFKDKSRNEYWYNGRWNKTTRRKEVIGVRGETPHTEEVIYTRFGPVAYEDDAQKPTKAPNDVPTGAAVRWIAHERSNDLLTFYLLNRSANYADYRKALATYTAPAQNFVFASADNDIAITPNGRYPLKYRDQGKFVLDGTDPADDWHGWIPADQNPTVKNPPRGFVSSANQSSTDATYPYYLNWQFGPYQRGARINGRLAAMNKITIDSMRTLQTDNYSITARDILPTLLNNLKGTKLDTDQQQALDLLTKWDLYYNANSAAATIFDRWWENLYQLIWKDEFEVKGVSLQIPSRDRTIKLLTTEPGSKWFDEVSTPTTETCADMVQKAFKRTVTDLVRDHGKKPQDWQWGTVRPVEIGHLASLPGFGSGKFASGGNRGIVNAISGSNGPSWRMVVQMGPQVKGYGIYPGGQSGNPGSFYYTDMLQTWKNGELNELLFMRSPDERSQRISSTLIMTKK
ncbi:penicillin acylase family protein [Mucilaginibacter daejeonensis]|uniref:penicillin acylase family protein n=1 Tax=Mucilaginibacter daejeonensis TaxID=398049 RepID=UPI001D16FFF3|nr:penicillin acylase family protein [Mucilaginibacter daejeonensis]UEG52303.1 penicillin acylase family protein [Mucilaginibacter daejeonensis]